MKILYFGTSSFAQPALQALCEHEEHQVVAVVTQPDRPAGRGGKLTASPVKELAIALNLPVLQPESCRTPEFLAAVHALNPDLSVVAAYGQFLPDALLVAPRGGSVNLHGSLLPKYRGAAPIQRALWQGEDTSGVCLMWMVREMDAGDVIACAAEPILPDDTAGTLSAKLALRAADLLLHWLPTIGAGSAPRTPQDPHLVTFAPSITKGERAVDWSQPGDVLERQVRALSPTPSATTIFRDLPVKILCVKYLHDFFFPAGVPGEIAELQKNNGLYVRTGKGALEIISLQPAGKRPMSGADFARGYRIVPGERFSS